MSNGLGGNAFTRNIWFDLDTRSMSHEALPSPLCDLCTCYVWRCDGQWLRRCIYKKILYLTLTLGSRSHKMLPSSLDIMWPMHQQSLISHGSGEDAFTRKYIIWPWHSGQSHTKWCSLPSTPCGLCTYRVWSYYVKRFNRRYIYKKIHYLTFDLDFGVTVAQNVAQHPLHHVHLFSYKVWSCYV